MQPNILQIDNRCNEVVTVRRSLHQSSRGARTRGTARPDESVATFRLATEVLEKPTPSGPVAEPPDASGQVTRSSCDGCRQLHITAVSLSGRF